MDLTKFGAFFIRIGVGSTVVGFGVTICLLDLVAIRPRLAPFHRPWARCYQIWDQFYQSRYDSTKSGLGSAKLVSTRPHLASADVDTTRPDVGTVRSTLSDQSLSSLRPNVGRIPLYIWLGYQLGFGQVGPDSNCDAAKARLDPTNFGRFDQTLAFPPNLARLGHSIVWVPEPFGGEFVPRD